MITIQNKQKYLVPFIVAGIALVAVVSAVVIYVLLNANEQEVVFETTGNGSEDINISFPEDRLYACSVIPDKDINELRLDIESRERYSA